MTVSGANAITGPEIRPLRGFTWTCAMTVLNNRYDGRSLKSEVIPGPGHSAEQSDMDF